MKLDEYEQYELHARRVEAMVGECLSTPNDLADAIAEAFGMYGPYAGMEHPHFGVAAAVDWQNAYHRLMASSGQADAAMLEAAQVFVDATRRLISVYADDEVSREERSSTGRYNEI